MSSAVGMHEICGAVVRIHVAPERAKAIAASIGRLRSWTRGIPLLEPFLAILESEAQGTNAHCDVDVFAELSALGHRHVRAIQLTMRIWDPKTRRKRVIVYGAGQPLLVDRSPLIRDELAQLKSLTHGLHLWKFAVAFDLLLVMAGIPESQVDRAAGNAASFGAASGGSGSTDRPRLGPYYQFTSKRLQLSGHQCLVSFL